jgi:tetratricopeptide (TPR) repeat protein
MNWVIRNLITNKRNNNIIYTVLFGIIILDFLNDQTHFIKQEYLKIDFSLIAIFILIVKWIIHYLYGSLYKKNEKIIERIKELAKTDNYDEIINTAKRINLIKPHIAEKKYWIGYANLYKNNNAKKALEYFQGLEKDFPFFAGLFYIKGIALIEENKLEEAITELSRAIELDGNWQNYDQRGVAYLRLEKFELAKKDFEKSISIQEDHSNLNNLGILYDKQGKHNEAIEFYTKSLNLKEDNSNGYYNRALANYYLKRFEKAIEDNSKTINLEPNRAWAYYNRALCFQELKKYDLAIADYSKAENLKIENKYLYLNRGICNVENNEIENGIRDLRKAVELDCSEASELIKKYENR